MFYVMKKWAWKRPGAGREYLDLKGVGEWGTIQSQENMLEDKSKTNHLVFTGNPVLCMLTLNSYLRLHVPEGSAAPKQSWTWKFGKSRKLSQGALADLNCSWILVKPSGVLVRQQGFIYPTVSWEQVLIPSCTVGMVSVNSVCQSPPWHFLLGILAWEKSFGRGSPFMLYTLQSYSVGCGCSKWMCCYPCSLFLH